MRTKSHYAKIRYETQNELHIFRNVDLGTNQDAQLMICPKPNILGKYVPKLRQNWAKISYVTQNKLHIFRNFTLRRNHDSQTYNLSEIEKCGKKYVP